MEGKESKWCSAGDDIAERVSIKDEMTSAEAGLTVTRFDARRRTSRRGPTGKDRRRRSSFDNFSSLDPGLTAVLAEVLSGIVPCFWSNIATSR